MKNLRTVYLIAGLLMVLFFTPLPILSQDDVTEGTLQIKGKDGKITSTCPLKHTDVKADISGFIARVNVTQKFYNPSKEKIEAIYVFPLPQRAAVDNMEMKIGNRTIKADIKKKEEAKKIYEAAKKKGQVASLLEQERPNIFTQSVANIMPGESVDIFISYVEYLNYQDGVYEFVFPMVVGPRYIPGNPTGQGGTGWAPDTDQVPDASRITPPVTPKGTRAGHDISVSVTLDAGVPIKSVRSVLHGIDLQHQPGSSTAKIFLASQTTIPNKDFILQYETAGKEVEDALLYNTRDKEGGFFSLILQPPLRPKTSEISPKEMIFVIDSSGSQQGWPIEKAKETMKYCIENMNEGDTFNLIAFSNNVDMLFDSPQTNNLENREKALDFLSKRLGGGGTEMMPAVLAALDPPEDKKRPRIVCFMTDGYVGNDMQIIDAVQKHLGNARFFSFGVGNSVNRYLLDKMASMGRGEVEYVTLNRHGDEVAEAFQRKIGTPLLTDIQVDWSNLPIHDVYPKQNPDLFSGKPLIITGRYKGHGTGTITLKGKRAGQEYARKINIDLPEKEGAHDVLASLWARTCIEELTDKNLTGIQLGKPDKSIEDQITTLGLEFRLMTQFTSFVAVEEKIITEGGVPKTIVVPVEMPDGVSYEGVFGEKEEKAKAQPSAPMATMAPANGPSGGTYSRSSSVNASPYAQSYPSGTIMRDEDLSYQEPSKKPEDKIDTSLKGIAEKALKSGGNLKCEGFEVKNGNIRLIITVTHVSGKALDALKKTGFSVDTYSAMNKVITGTVKVEQIDKIAKLTFVDKIEPFVSGKSSGQKSPGVISNFTRNIVKSQNESNAGCSMPKPSLADTTIRSALAQNESILLSLQPELLRLSHLLAMEILDRNSWRD